MAMCPVCYNHLFDDHHLLKKCGKHRKWFLETCVVCTKRVWWVCKDYTKGYPLCKECQDEQKLPDTGRMTKFGRKDPTWMLRKYGQSSWVDWDGRHAR